MGCERWSAAVGIILESGYSGLDRHFRTRSGSSGIKSARDRKVRGWVSYPLRRIEEDVIFMPRLFLDRDDAGRRLADVYKGPERDAIVLGIPRGGIPVGYFLAEKLLAPLDVIVVRKLPLPDNPETGFGAIAPDGTTTLNQDIVGSLRLPPSLISRISSSVLREVHRREELYRGNRPFPQLSGKNVILTDDGLATGYTMIAAIEMARDKGAGSVNVAVPASPRDTATRIERLSDYFLCLYISDRYPFAVASFYHDFHDMSDEEVMGYLRAEPEIRRQ
jgi:putative phosphoribosyl transferase